jgi:hypothetical protein
MWLKQCKNGLFLLVFGKVPLKILIIGDFKEICHFSAFFEPPIISIFDLESRTPLIFGAKFACLGDFFAIATHKTPAHRG